MAKSSIHFRKVSAFSFKHNETSRPAYAIFDPDENEINRSAKAAKQMWDRLYDRAIEKLTAEGVKRKPEKKNTLHEAVINLENWHTLDDIEALSQEIEAELGITALQISVHRDEGHINEETGDVKMNYHAHVTYFTLDQETGRQNWRQAKVKPKLSEIQDLVADRLGMERGKSSTRRHIESGKYREMMQGYDKLKSIAYQLAEENEILKEQIKSKEDEEDRVLRGQKTP